MNIKSMLPGLLTATCLAGPALATEGPVGPVLIRSLAVVGAPFGGHQAGNIEITLSTNLPAQFGCSDKTYITTSIGNDPDRAMLAMLLDAKLKGRTVKLQISDDVSRRAFANRCSVLAVESPWPVGISIPATTDPVECNTKLCNQ